MAKEAANAVERGYSTGFVYYIVRRDCGMSRSKHTWNPFHCMADVFLAIEILAALELRPVDVVVLFADSNAESPYEHVWRTVGAAGVYTAAGLAAVPSHIRPPMRRAIVAPDQAASLMWQTNHHYMQCQHTSDLYRTVRSHVVRALGIAMHQMDLGADQVAKSVLLVARQPHVHQAGGMDRTISNTDEVLAAMKRGVIRALEGGLRHRLPASLNVEAVDFAGMPVREQIWRAASARVMVGMHGAGLTWSMFQPPIPGSGLIELHPQWKNNGIISKCFANQAVASGINYARWHAGPEESKYKGETRVDPLTVEGLVMAILGQDPSTDAGPGLGGPGVLGLVRTGDPTAVGKMPRPSPGSSQDS